MELKQAQLATIIYEKADGEVTTRTIVPASVPAGVVRALDVTDLTPAEREELQQLYREYVEYVDNFKANMFNFETWIEHSKGKVVPTKWRSFSLTGLRS